MSGRKVDNGVTVELSSEDLFSDFNKLKELTLAEIKFAFEKHFVDGKHPLRMVGEDDEWN